MAAKTTEKKLSGKEALKKLMESKPDLVVNPSLLEVTGATTNNIAIDMLSGVGGFPRGRVSESCGMFSAGKTTVATQALAQEQQLIIDSGSDELIMFVDFEHSFDPVYAEKLGLDTTHDSFVYISPDTLEEGCSAYRDILDTGDLRMSVFDSVAAMVPEKEKTAETGKAEVGLRAKLLAQFLRQVVGTIHKTNSVLIFCNHLMEKLDITFMGQQMAARGIKQYTSPGGTAIPFYSSFRVMFEKKGQVKTKAYDALLDVTDDEVTAQTIKMTVIKNKVGPAYRTCELRLERNKGFSNVYSVYSVLFEHGIIKKSGSWFKVSPEITGGKEGVQFHGEDATLTELENNATLYKAAHAKAVELLAEHGLKTAKVDTEDGGSDATTFNLGGQDAEDSSSSNDS